MTDLIKNLNTRALDNCFAGLQREDSPLALATVVQAISPTSGNPGDKALVSADAIIEGWIGGGCAQPAVIEAARGTLETGEAQLIRVGPKGEWEPMQGVVDFTSGCLSGGTLLIFVEPMIKQPSLAILGNSPAAHSLCQLASEVGFAVTLAYPGLESTELPENARIADDFSEIGDDYIVIATQGKHDRDAMKAALASNARHIAMIASNRKIAGLKASFAKAGTEPNQLDRIHSPAGIEIGAVTPAEIALSVLAELVRVRRDANPAELPVVRSDAMQTEPAAETLVAQQSGGCCGG